ncbi:reverse transcriptase domain-containing protein [Tanacetum coccineum]
MQDWGVCSKVYTQEKGIDYDEVFTPVARIEAIRLFLAYASFKDFVVYQIDVKSAFILYDVTDEHALDNSPPPLWEDYDDELLDLETVNDDTYDDPFDFKEEKIEDSKILIDELDPPRSSDFLPFPEYDSVFYEDFSEVDALSSTNNEDKVFNPGILIHKNLFEVTNCATIEKNVKKTTNASLILEDFNPPLYELPFHKEVLGSETLLSFSPENEEKDCPDFEASCAHGFVLHSLELHILSFWESNILILSTNSLHFPSTSQPQKKQKPRKPKRKDTEVPQPSGPTDNVADEVVYEEMDDWKRIFEKRTKNQAKTDKTEHGMEKRGKGKVKSKPKSQPKSKSSQPQKSQSQTRSRNRRILNEPIRTHLMGQVSPLVYYMKTL